MSVTIMYHASSRAVRESIQEHGLDRLHFGNTPKPTNTQDVTWAPRGNYLDESLPSVVRAYGTEVMDFWEVRAEGLKFCEDEAWAGGWRCLARIKPERLRRLAREEIALV